MDSEEIGPYVSRLIEIQQRVLEFAKEEVRDRSGDFFSPESLGKLAGLKSEFFSVSVEMLVATHKDFRGDPLFDNTLIEVEVSNVGNVAPRISFGPYKAEIEIPVLFAGFLDFSLFAWEIPTSKNLEAAPDLATLNFLTQASFEEAGISPYKWFYGLFRRLAHEDSSNDGARVYLSVLGSLFVLMHEIGHFICGHTRYHHKDMNLDADPASLKLSYSEANDQLSLDEGWRRWIAETTADLYGFIYLYVLNDKAWPVVSASYHTSSPRIIQPLLEAVTVSLRVGSFLSAQKESTDNEMPAHPHMSIRESSIWGVCHFCMSPLPQQWNDVRRTLLDETHYAQVSAPISFVLEGRQYFEYENWVLGDLVRCAEKIHWGFGKNGLLEEEGQYEFIVKRVFSAFGYKYGIYLPFSAAPPYVSSDVLLAGGILKSMSEGINANYFQWTHKFWTKVYPDIQDAELYDLSGHDGPIYLKLTISNSPLIRDPIFKIIDDLMSVAYRYAKSEESDDAPIGKLGDLSGEREKILEGLVGWTEQVTRNVLLG